MGIALAGAFIGIIWAYIKYIKQAFVPKEDQEITGFAAVVYNKFYIDELYNLVIVKPLNSLAGFFKTILEPAIGSLVFGFGKGAYFLSNQGKKLHTGSVGFYLFAFVIGVCAILIYLFIA